MFKLVTLFLLKKQFKLQQFYCQVQRDQLESHNEFSNLACRELKEPQEKSKKIFKDIQLKVDFLQQQHQQGVGILKEQFEEKLNTNQAKLEKKHQQLERKFKY